MQLPKVIEARGIRVLTTKQLANEYGAREIQISQNFTNNRSRFIEGKHYVSLSGDELREFKKHFENFELVNSRTSHLYLWTEKGALLHAKSLNTDKAWEVYDYLVDFYFRVKEEQKKVQLVQVPAIPAPQEKPKQLVVDVPRNVEAQRLIRKMRRYLMGLEAVLDAYDAYHKAEDFKGVCGTLMDISAYTTKVAFQLSEFKPNMIERT